jgi:stearoyl-CoA desaturase (Delta-9 desaturase)
VTDLSSPPAICEELTDQTSGDPLEKMVSADVRIWNFFGVLVPFLGLAAAVVLFWGHGCNWTQLSLMLSMYIVTGIGVTVGFHRLFTHRAFETVPVIRAILIVMGSMSVEGNLLTWVAQHRQHHQFPDRDGDPHSPHLHGAGMKGLLAGFWHAHIGWFFDAPNPDMPKYVGDLLEDPLVRRMSALFKLWVVLGFLLPAAAGGLISHSWTGFYLGLIWGGLLRVFLIHHVTWSINSVCHIWGTRPFRTADESRNNALFAVLAFGEGWHNNHHAFPNSARHGLRWWQIDTSYVTIRFLEIFKLAWKVKLPSTSALSRKSGQATGSVSETSH